MSKKYFMVGNAHLDPVWQWQMHEGLSLIKSTFKAALDRMEAYPDYIFTSACAGYYKWIKYSEPEMFEKICEKIKEGRWKFTGGMWVQPDCNIPSGESFARHFLYSQKFFRENFGYETISGYNVDSFGHNGMLPQLFRKAGIENYVYMRPHRDPEKPNLPENNVHWWESPDSSKVLVFRILDGYGDDLRDERIERYESQKNSQILSYGVGNHGGGPTIETLEQAEKLRKLGIYSYSGVDDYFNCIRENETENLPTVSEDLQHHASGCYSANSKIKKLNRKTESSLIQAEKIDVLSSILTNSTPHTEKIESAWERVMFNQFHDILAGCSIKDAYPDAYNAFGYAAETAFGINSFASERISWRINTTKNLDGKLSEHLDRLWVKEGEGCPMVVFNPHSFPVHTYVSFGTQHVCGVVDSDYNDIPFQLVRAPYTDGDHINQCMFEVALPAYGYATYFLFRNGQNYEAEKRDNQFTVSENSIENSKVKISFNADGDIVSYFNKTTNKELCASPFKAVICEDKDNDTWGHKVFDYNQDIGCFKNAQFEILETGSLRATLKVTSFYNNSKLVRYYSLYKDSEKIEVRCKLDFREEYKSVKLTFPADIKNPKAIYSMPFGFIEKEADSLEEPAHTWVSVCDDMGQGLALLNDCKYSFCSKGNEMRMLVARNCAYLDHFGQDKRDGEMEFIDFGEQDFTYQLQPFDKENISETVKAAEILNTDLRVYLETHHEGTLPTSFGGIDVKNDNIIVQAIKISEDKSGYILRCFECSGKETDAEIDFKAIGRSFKLHFNPQEINTVFIPFDDGEIKTVLLTER